MQLYRIETGKVRIKKNQLTKTDGFAPKMTRVLFDRQWSDWLPIYAWIIEHQDGLFVIDTGETHKTGKDGYLPKWHPYYAFAVDFDVKPEDEIGPKMKNLGINPSKAGTPTPFFKYFTMESLSNPRFSAFLIKTLFNGFFFMTGSVLSIIMPRYSVFKYASLV